MALKSWGKANELRDRRKTVVGTTSPTEAQTNESGGKGAGGSDAGVRCQVTQYGYPDDPYSDSLTEAGWGAWDNKLNLLSAALTRNAEKKLGATKGCKLEIKFDDGTIFHRHFDDRAPQDDLRCDLYMPAGFVHTIPDWATVKVII